MRTGFLMPLGGAPSLFADRYHLAGPTSVRMFRPNAMGPKDSGASSSVSLTRASLIISSRTGDYIGGDMHWATGLSLTTPFPKKPEWPLRTHFFLNAGRLARLQQGAFDTRFGSAEC